jgi:HlyD family secretion protein
MENQTIDEKNMPDVTPDSGGEDSDKNAPVKKKRFISFDKETKRIYIGKKSIKRKTAIIFLIILVIIAAAVAFVSISKKGQDKQPQFTMVKAERKNIENTVTASSTLEANDSYNVTALVTGEVLSDTFNEGDTVQKDDVLYKIEATTAQNSVDSAKNALTKAQQSYQDAVKNKSQTSQSNNYSIQSAQNAVAKAQNTYNEAVESLEDLDVKSNYTGTISAVHVKNGDNVQSGTAIADVYDDSRMKIQLPFNENDANLINVGDSAKLTVAGASDELWGSVTSVSGASIATDNHAIVKYVIIEVDNPGALTINDKATAEVGSVVCSDVGTFEYIDSGTITAKTAGKVESVNIEENDKVYYDEVVVNLSSETIENTMENAQLSLDDAQISLEKAVLSSDEYSQDSSIKNAKLSLDDARLALEKANKTLEDYTIKAPISGTVVVKNTKAGDKLDNSSNSQTGQTAMAIIYDLSCLKLQLDIDETDVGEVKVGQEVTITADAVPGQTFTGVVEKVGVDGTSENGVTTYPVKVTIQDYGDLLPGMNVDAKIVTAKAENVLALPVGTINRGNVVYVKGEKTDENDKAPEGFKSVTVETGINDDSYIEIKSGIDENTEVRGPVAASGNDTSGTVEQQQQNMMGGGMPGGGMPAGGGGMPSGGGGNRSGGGMPGGGMR